MSFWDKIKTTIKGNEDFSELKSSTFRDVLNGNILTKSFLTKHYRLFALIALLLIFYINNRYVVENLMAKELRLKEELQDVKFESLSVSAELTKLSRRSYVLNYINRSGLDLVESPYSPIKITAPDPKKDQVIIEEKESHKSATEKIKKDSTNTEEYIKE